MGYRRRYRRRAPAPRARFVANKYTGYRFMHYANAGIRALEGVRQLKEIINSEKKTFSSSPAVNTLVNTATPFSPTELTGITMGDDYANREGRSILAKSLELKVTAALDIATLGLIRFIIVRDQNHDGSDPLLTEILTSAAVQSLRSADPTHMKRFKIMYDKTYCLDQAKSQTFSINWFTKLNHHIKFAGVGANTSNQGSLWLLMVSSASASGGGGIRVNANTRVRYYDN